MSDDYTKDTSTTGAVAVGGTSTGEIETGNDFDWFAVGLVAGRTYVIDLEGADSGGGTLDSTVLRGIYDSQGTRIAGTQTNDGGDGDDARLVFTATESGTHYIAARGYRNETGTYTVRVTEEISDDTRAGAYDLGDITEYDRPRFPSFSLDGDGDRVDYFKFTLTEAKKVGLGLRRQDADADLFLEDVHGKVLFSSTREDTSSEWISETLLAGTYYVRVEAQEAGANDFRLRHGVGAPDADRVAELEAAQEEAINEAPAFAEAGYAFGLAENADGSANRVALGTVSATDPDGDAPAYSIVAGNGDGLFEIDASTGALSYKGTGEDHESGTASHVLTVRASDGTLHSDVAVTVTVADVAEPEISASDAEAEESDGVLRFRVTLSEATTAPVSVRYATADGTATAGEDYTSGSGTLVFLPGETEKTVEVTLVDDDVEDSGETLKLRLSDAVGGSLSVANATGTILNSEATNVSEPEDGDLAADTTTTGRVLVDGSVTGAIGSVGDRDWFAVELEAGKTYRIDLWAPWPGFVDYFGTLRDPYLRGIYDADGEFIPGTTDDNGGVGSESRMTFTPAAAGTYYVAAGESGDKVGAYTLLVRDITSNATTSDDYPSGTSTTGTIEVGGSATGEIGYRSDRDWFKVELEADKTYLFDLEGSDTAAGTLGDPYLHGIHDADGNLIEGTSDGYSGVGLNGRVTFTPEAAGTYYVAAGASVGHEGTYRLSVTDRSQVADDFTAGTGTDGVVEVGGSAMGALELAHDRDWFEVELEADTTYLLDLEGSRTDAGTLSDPYILGIHDAGGDLIDGTTDDDSGVSLNSRVTFTPSEEGTYYVAAGGNSTRIGTYTLSVTEASTIEDDFSAGTDTTGTVAVGGSATGEIEVGGDRDWFAVTLEAGKTYQFDLEGSPTDAGTMLNPVLWGIHDSEGELIDGTMNNDGGHRYNARSTFAASEGGTYYVAAGDQSYSNAADLGTYTLSVEEVI